MEMTGADIVILACNTASTTALSAIRAVVDVPVIGVVPAIKPAGAISRTKTIAVLGTPGTVKREYVDSLINDHAHDCRVILQGSVNLVALAEQKLRGEAVPKDYIRREIAPIFEGRDGADVDAVVLACTHFPLLRDELQGSVKQTVRWIDSGRAIAKRVKFVLEEIGVAQGCEFSDQNAFLIGPDDKSQRVQAFKARGFEHIIGLCPDD